MVTELDKLRERVEYLEGLIVGDVAIISKLQVVAKKYEAIRRAVGDVENAVIISAEKQAECVSAAQKLEAIREIVEVNDDPFCLVCSKVLEVLG